VINDAAFLTSLPHREKVAGMAEAVKVALIRDAAFFEWLVQNARGLARAEAEPLAYLIRRCAELHLQHIGTSGDPFEFGSARPLDFGHWAAHKLESMTDYRLRHGGGGRHRDCDRRAVLRARRLSRARRSGKGAADAPSPRAALVGDPALEEETAEGDLRVLAGLAEFREHLGGELTVTLLQAIGEGFEVHRMDEALIRRAVLRLRQRAEAS
jgi:3-dehydroquinate synthase